MLVGARIIFKDHPIKDSKLILIIKYFCNIPSYLRAFCVLSSLTFLITAATCNPTFSDVVLVEINGGSGMGHITVSGSIPNMAETNKIVDWGRTRGTPVKFSKVDYDPVFCPWTPYFYPCMPFDQAGYDQCVLEEIKSVNGALTDRQYNDFKVLAGKKCYEDTKY